jgi:PAS domain S-box-containing protein
MIIKRLRNKLLLSAIAISMAVALISMLTVSWVINQQYLGQSNALLLNASNVIDDHLLDSNNNLLTASQQLATQKNLGSNIWYLTQYAQLNLDREMLFNTYQQLVRETYKIASVAKLSRIAIYDSAGKLVYFALLGSASHQVGFVERFPAPVFQVATLKDGEELNRKNLRTTNAIARMGFEFDGPLPQQESVHYAVVDGLLAVESHVPIMGEAFDPNTGKLEIKQLGLVVMAQEIDQPFVDHLSRLTNTKINIFTSQGLSSGSVAAYRSPDWNSVQASSDTKILEKSFNETTIEGEDYYQRLIPLYTDKQLVGTIASLYSKEIVRKNTLEMMQTLGLIAAASLVFIFPFSWYFATSISHPLTVLSRIFRGVASGKQIDTLSDELSQLEKEKMRPDELGDLTQSFIAMNDAVNQKILQINEINASLEHKIEERTAALVASEQESRTMIENSPDTIARYDRDCRRIYVNPAFSVLAKDGATALLGTKPSEYPGGPNSEIYEAKIKEVITTGEDAQFELKWLGKDGKEICSHIRLTAEWDLSGTITSVLAVGRDITELKRARNELNQAKENAELALAEQRQFIAMISHEYRSPLAVIDSAAQLLGVKLPAESDTAPILARIRRGVSRLSNFIDNCMAEDRLDSEALTLHLSAINLHAFAASAIESAQLISESHKIIAELDPNLPLLTADTQLLGILLLNLLGNAIKYSPAGSEVRLRIAHSGQDCNFEVIDKGQGIPADELPLIFKKYIRGRAAASIPGAGLGLSLVSRIVALHGGSVRMESIEGEGTRVTVTIPLNLATGREEKLTP